MRFNAKNVAGLPSQGLRADGREITIRTDETCFGGFGVCADGGDFGHGNFIFDDDGQTVAAHRGVHRLRRRLWKNWLQVALTRAVICHFQVSRAAWRSLRTATTDSAARCPYLQIDTIPRAPISDFILRNGEFFLHRSQNLRRTQGCRVHCSSVHTGRIGRGGGSALDNVSLIAVINEAGAGQVQTIPRPIIRI